MALTNLRKMIDEVDDALIKLLEKRFEIVKQIGEYKKEHNLPILDKTREEAVLNKIKDRLTNKEDFEHFKIIYQLLMDLSKDLEK